MATPAPAKKKALLRRLPRLLSGSFVQVTASGALEVNGRRLFNDPKVKEAIAKLHRNIQDQSK